MIEALTERPMERQNAALAGQVERYRDAVYETISAHVIVQ
jgi:hypothetical protein